MLVRVADTSEFAGKIDGISLTDAGGISQQEGFPQQEGRPR